MTKRVRYILFWVVVLLTKVRGDCVGVAQCSSTVMHDGSYTRRARASGFRTYDAPTFRCGSTEPSLRLLRHVSQCKVAQARLLRYLAEFVTLFFDALNSSHLRSVPFFCLRWWLRSGSSTSSGSFRDILAHSASPGPRSCSTYLSGRERSHQTWTL